MPRLPLDEFLTGPTHAPIFDARAPLEYTQGHIPGAVSFPIFSDEERARIGTTYKQVSQDKAVLLGLDFFGPKMSQMVKQAQKLAPQKEVRLHCWRGGMRSGAMQWLLELAGFKVHLLDKGYKDYRRWALGAFAEPRPLLVLGGLTGSGKTDVLQELARRGEPVVDLEGLAHHKGSSFGAIGLPPQPTPEQFENELAWQLRHLPSETPAWLEDESRMIGAIPLPGALFEQMSVAPLVLLEVPRAARTRKLADEYGSQDPQLLREAIGRIQKRLGGLATKEALAAIDAGDMEKMVALALDYYDKTYTHGLENRRSASIVRVTSDTCDAAVNAELVLRATHEQRLGRVQIHPKR
ncbi:tRNA 2-selenouridine(34) synthase MnmH [Hymenobacter busanensis]|uniref:tRNA 2-selenouridine(34) synthase MnmH n=1 Tax=Hymenobacter busanensis TaxID=2607656 RepID=A0A7L5A0H1_9BACT|nr:tRNA 2-selenouridine(34) synthase MnmH [Hymenobacter busanensis]KAA9331529.1 tRNA 2-selenouridine(34) synthase MnmH [Hymenobacter busanensis]QHJ08683.1 tRNA 2-selenouridine(34) synthase MnmH [Hymenobacter busanensis]